MRAVDRLAALCERKGWTVEWSEEGWHGGRLISVEVKHRGKHLTGATLGVWGRPSEEADRDGLAQTVGELLAPGKP